MSDQERKDLEREEDDVEAHAAATEPAESDDDDGNDFEAHLFQRR